VHPVDGRIAERRATDDVHASFRAKAQLAQPVRVALTGRTASPGLFEVMEILGRDRTLFRLRQGIDRASHPGGRSSL
jgi:glutamyl/glutaminyl-tRNA synthetase